MAVVSNAYELISSYTIPSATTGYTFNSFSGYKHLRLIVHGGIVANLWATRMQLNGDTGSNYFVARNVTYEPSAYEPEITTFQDDKIYVIAAGQAPNNNANMAVVDFLDYANTTKQKLILSRFAGRGASERSVGYSINRFGPSNAAITSIYIFESVSTGLTAGTKLSLYGIKEAT
jgi:hypothetical protein